MRSEVHANIVVSRADVSLLALTVSVASKPASVRVDRARDVVVGSSANRVEDKRLVGSDTLGHAGSVLGTVFVEVTSSGVELELLGGRG